MGSLEYPIRVSQLDEARDLPSNCYKILKRSFSFFQQFDDDASIEESFSLLREPVCLDTCLKNFTEEEELGEDETW